MSEKELLALSDPRVQPGDDLIFSLIGENKIYWQKLLKQMLSLYSDVTWSWNWYNDGKQWLFKLVQKKKTIFWSAILSTGQFRVTFYFGDKAEPILSGSTLPQNIKDNFKTAKKYGAIRAVTLLVQSDEDVDIVLKLAEIKVKMK